MDLNQQLHNAIERGHKEIVVDLIRAGADI
jgi:hypothetical protein